MKSASGMLERFGTDAEQECLDRATYCCALDDRVRQAAWLQIMAHIGRLRLDRARRAPLGLILEAGDGLD